MIQDVKVVPGCISCRTCENICPDVFRVNPKSKVITNQYTGKETEILMAEAMCPVNVIKVNKIGNVSFNFKESKIISKKMLTKDIVELTLLKPADFRFKPGQYISVMFENWKGKFSRQYSIASQTDESFTLTIRLLEKGRGSTKIKKLKAGKSMQYLGPLGNFYLQNTKKEKYFISTGTGLAPFIAMAEALDPNIKKYFIIGGRTTKDLYYTQKLQNFENTQVQYFLSKEQAEGYNHGRVTDAISSIPKDAEIYVCGNPNMVSSVLEITKKLGYNDVYSEDFTVSGKYNPLYKEIFINGNIPLLKQFSWFIIFISFVLAALFVYKTGNGTIYKPFLGFKTFFSFVYELSWIAVVFVMMIRPISDIFYKSKFLRKLKQLRKPLGILSATVIVMGLISNWIYNPSAMTQYFTNINRWNSIKALIPRLSEITAVILLLTSNSFSQKKLGKYWKYIQRLSYIYFITGGINAAINSYPITNGVYIKYYGAIGLWLFFFALASIINKKSKNKLSIKFTIS